MPSEKKISPKELKEAPFITAFNNKTQRQEPVIFANGIQVDLPHVDFRRGIELTSGGAPVITTNRLYNENGELKFNGQIISTGSHTLSSAAGWTDDGSTVRLTTATDSVGIGTSSPSYKLDITGDARIFGDDGYNSSGERAKLYFGDGLAGVYSEYGLGLVFAVYKSSGNGGLVDGSGNSMDVIWIAESSGQVGIGTSSPDTLLELSKDSADTELTISTYHNTEATTPKITLRKADNTEASPALVDDNAVLGTISFQGYDGSGFEQGAKIEARVDGTPSDGSDMPTELTFWTTPDGSATAVQRMTIDPDGNVGIGTDAPEAYLEIRNVVDDGTTNRTMLRLHNYRADDADVNDFGPISIDFEVHNVHGNGKSGIARIAAVQAPIGTDHTTPAGEKTSGLIFSTMDDDTLAEAMRINAVGNVGIGTTSPDTLLELSKDSADTELTISTYHNTEATTPKLTLRKADNTEASPALVDDNAVLGTISFQGYDGSGFEQGAKIEARVDGTPSDGSDMPTELTFWTTPDGSATAVQRMTITPAGNVAIDEDQYLYLNGASDANWKFGKDSSHNIFLDGAGSGTRRFAVRDASDSFAERFVVDLDGAQVGIAGATLDAPLNVKCTSTKGIYFEKDDSTSFWNIYYDTANDYLQLKHSNGVGSATVNEDDNVGLIDFTGQHRSFPASGSASDYSDKVGLIVVSSGEYKNLSSGSSDIVINEALPKVELSAQRNQKSVFGVISDTEDLNESTRSYFTGKWGSIYTKAIGDDRLIINSLGEGAVWVTNINGNFENGDYITSCEIPGYGMKQDDDFLHNYTVAKMTQDCDFNLEASNYICEEIEYDGQTYRKAFVGCTYHCG